MPILQIVLSVKSLTSEKIYNKRATKGVFHLGLCYYNPISGKLEPILEPTGLLMGFIEAKNSNPEQYLTVELEDVQKPLNFNVSEDMIAGLVRTYYSLSSEYSEGKLMRRSQGISLTKANCSEKTPFRRNTTKII